MKIKITLLAILSFCVSIFCGAFAQAAEKKPQAVLLETAYTFDPVTDGTDVTHDFILRNNGDADLIIVNINSG